MIDYSPTARQHVLDLLDYYRRQRWPEAACNLRGALSRVEAALTDGTAKGRPFPATYRTLSRPGRLWINEAIYLIVFEATVPPAIVAVFWERAEIDRRYPEDC